MAAQGGEARGQRLPGKSASEENIHGGLTVEQRLRVEQLLRQASEWVPSERSRLLAAMGKDDPAVVAAVERLLAEREEAGAAGNAGGAPDEPTATVSLREPRMFEPGELVAGRYRICEFVAAGGMGEVYEAEDLTLGERVALKTIRPERARHPRPRARFVREVRMARQVTHPNVCRVFDVGQHRDARAGEEVLFLTMERLAGETLAEKLKKERRIGPREALAWIRQMAEGLAAAHDAGVIHGDFKPANVMLAEGRGGRPRAVISDFGLARSLVETGHGDATLDGHGEIAGTPPYMAPEQFRGARPSVATDIYSLGVVIFEMVTGRRPFERRTAREFAKERAGQETPKAGQDVPGLHPQWDVVIAKCLDADPRARFGSAREVVGALEPPQEGTRTAIVERTSAWDAVKSKWGGRRGVVAAIVLIGVIAVMSKIRPGDPRLAVMPFEPVGGDASLEVLARGLTETLSSSLSSMPDSGLSVVPASEVASSAPRTVEEVRNRFNVNRVVTGSIQRIGDRVRLTLNLIDAAELRQLGSRVLDEDAGGLFSLQNRAAATLRELLGYAGAHPPGGSGAPPDPAAYASYVVALGHMQRWDDEKNLVAAIDLLKEATATDPGFAQAYSSLGEAYRMRYSLDKRQEWLEQALENASQAARLNPGLVPVQVTLGRVYSTMGRDELALEALERALRVDPKSADGHAAIARVYEKLGRVREAEEAYRTSLTFEDLWRTRNALGDLYFRQHRYEEALRHWRRVLDVMPDNVVALVNVGAALAESGKVAEARSMYEKAVAIQPNYTAYMNLGTLHFREQRFGEAARMFEKALELNDRDYLPWGNLAAAYWSSPGRKDKAITTYERAARMAEEVRTQNPRDPFVHADLGGYYARLGRSREAIERVEAALALAPDHREVAIWAAEAYAVLGQREKALALVKRAIAGGYPVERVRSNPELRVLMP